MSSQMLSASCDKSLPPRPVHATRVPRRFVSVWLVVPVMPFVSLPFISKHSKLRIFLANRLLIGFSLASMKIRHWHRLPYEWWGHILEIWCYIQKNKEFSTALVSNDWQCLAISGNYSYVVFGDKFERKSTRNRHSCCDKIINISDKLLNASDIQMVCRQNIRNNTGSSIDFSHCQR